MTYSRYLVTSLDERLVIEDIPRMDGVWFHIVLNFFGFNDEQGITVYHDGVQLNNTARRTNTPAKLDASDGRIILGRSVDEKFDRSTPFDPYLYYSSVSIDELLFYNHILRDKEIMQIME